MTKDSESILQQDLSFKWGSGKEVDSIRTMSSQELSASFQGMLKGQNLKNGVWVFGYGSLMWNPDIKFAEKKNGFNIRISQTFMFKINCIQRHSGLSWFGVWFGPRLFMSGNGIQDYSGTFSNRTAESLGT